MLVSVKLLAAQVHAREVRNRLRNPPQRVGPPIAPPICDMPPMEEMDLTQQRNFWVQRREECDKHINEIDGEIHAISMRHTIFAIQKAVCEFFQINLAQLISNRRDQTGVRQRQIAMWLCKQITPRSLVMIGEKFGNRDHTTVLHSVRKIDGLLPNDPQLQETIESICRKIGVSLRPALNQQEATSCSLQPQTSTPQLTNSDAL